MSTTVQLLPTERQTLALKYLLKKSKDLNELALRIAFLLIDSSQGFSREVCATLVEDLSGFTSEEIGAAASAFKAMSSSNRTTHQGELFKLMGFDFRFDFHYGDYDPNREGDPFSAAGQFAGWDPEKVGSPELVLEGMPLRYTFWLNGGMYSRKAVLVHVDKQTLLGVDLDSPTLYSFC